jgi:beta-phosphoglucomutase-like phosphatase (HAD superfamily)
VNAAVASVGLIWDIDGVLVDSPHEQAWRAAAARKPWSVAELSAEFYFEHVASRPRYEGGHNILLLKGVYERLGAKDAAEQETLLDRFCKEKNAMIRELIAAGRFAIFEDALRLLLHAKTHGIRQAAASASKNVKAMLLRADREKLGKECAWALDLLPSFDTLYAVFDVDACGLDLGGKKAILDYAASELRKRFALTRFVVIEDAPSGVRAAKSSGYCAVGVLRIGTRKALERAGADLVLERLDTATVEDLTNLSRR